MKANRKLLWAVIPAMSLALGAAPGVQPVQPKPVAHPAPARPAPRQRVALGKAPAPTFQANKKSFTVDAKAPAVKSVRAIPPQAFKPTARKEAVDTFVKTELATKPINKDQLKRMNVGPFRNEYVYWGYYNWTLHDRAWWAWNNYSYFDQPLWADWMLDAKFAQEIAALKAANTPQVPGSVPTNYAVQPPAVVYNDSYLQAVYNPVLTPPSIVIDATGGLELANLVEGASRVTGAQPVPIDRVTSATVPLQFVALPAGFNPTYEIKVQRDGMLYLFGPTKTKLADGMKADEVDKWTPVAKFVSGRGIEAVYQRKVTAGDEIRIHGTEWTVASEQIELFNPASAVAKRTIHSQAADLTAMLAPNNDFVAADATLKTHLMSVQKAAADIITQNGNVDEERVADCHFEMAKVKKLAEQDLAANKNGKLADEGKMLVRDLGNMESDMNAVGDLRDPALVAADEATADAAPVDGGEAAPPAAVPVVAKAEIPPVADGAVDLLKEAIAGNLSANTVGDWKVVNGQIQCGSSGDFSDLRLSHVMTPAYDLYITMTRKSGDQVGVISKSGAKWRTEWWIGLKGNTITELSKQDGNDSNATSTKSAAWIKDGVPFNLVMHVRPGDMDAVIDGKTIFTTKFDKALVGLAVRPRKAIGSGGVCIDVAPSTEVSIQSIQIVDK